MARITYSERNAFISLVGEAGVAPATPRCKRGGPCASRSIPKRSDGLLMNCKCFRVPGSRREKVPLPFLIPNGWWSRRRLSQHPSAGPREGTYIRLVDRRRVQPHHGGRGISGRRRLE